MRRPLLLTALSLVTTTASAGPSADWKRMHGDRATASSYLKSNWNKYDENYHPAYLLDGDPKTAWVEGVDGNGEGQTVTIPLSDLKSARSVRLRLWNGYQKSKNLLDANAAPKDVTVLVRDLGGDVTGTATATLKKELGAQEVVVTIEKGRGVSSVTLRVDSTWPGRVYKDGCISDVEIFVDSDVPWSEKAEKARLAALKSWIGDRKSTAAAFSRLKPDYPWAATHFKVATPSLLESEETAQFDDQTNTWTRRPGSKQVDEQLDEGKPHGVVAKVLSTDDLKALQEIRALAKDKGASVSSSWRRVDVSRQQPVPDGVAELEGYFPSLRAVAAFIDTGAVTFFEAQGEAGGVSRSRPRDADDDWLRSWTTTNARVAFHPDGKTPQRVYFAERRIIEERETIDETDHYVLDFSADGRLQRARRVGGNKAWMSGTIVDFEYDGAGKVGGIRQRSISGGIGPGSDWNNGVNVQSVAVVADGTS
jgi:hypothetical protein